jgi:hypothetical protein
MYRQSIQVCTAEPSFFYLIMAAAAPLLGGGSRPRRSMIRRRRHPRRRVVVGTSLWPQDIRFRDSSRLRQEPSSHGKSRQVASRQLG